MPNYDQFKKAWNSMGNAERKKYTEQYKNDAQFQQFANQYSQEMKNTGSQGTVNQNLNTNTNQGTNTQQRTEGFEYQQNLNERTGQKKDYFAPENITDNSDEAVAERKRIIESGALDGRGVEKSVVVENFDSSRLTNPNAEVSVKEGTAAQTGMPDYEADSDARDNEIVNNLNAYINSNPEFFSDRATFNQNFHYSERNQRQKALLDSFWKGQEDRKKASSYSTGDSIVQGMNSGEITTDQMNYIKSMNPEAYREWQQKQEELVNKRIANYTVPADPVNTAELFNQLVEKLGLQQGDPYKIYENWYGMCEQLGVFALNSRLESKIAEIEQNANERTRALERITKEGAGRKAQNLINAEMAKTSAIYDARNADLQNAYNALYNQRQQNLAIANQSATALQMQGAEDSRVFNNKLAGLGFAMQTAAFRTPEQQLQNQLNFQAASNELNLLNQSRLNDLNLYNTYATNKLKNQMEAEATDLNTTDENQLRNNLNNVLSQYYSSYGDIIKRSQAQVVDDVIAYAKKNNCSIGEALTKNFIEPLQNKQEYKNMIAKNYAAPITQTVTINEDGTIDYKANTYGGVKYTPVSAFQMNSTLQDFMNSHSTGSTGGWCGKFVNDYLQSVGIGRLYGDSLSSKLNTINTDPTDLDNLAIGSVAVFDYSRINGVGENAKNYGHVAIVTDIDKEKGMVKLMESNYRGDKKVTNSRWVSIKGSPSLKGFFNPSKGAGASNLSNVDESKKQNYIEEAKRGMLTDTMIGKIGDLAAEQGWSSEWNEALKQGKSTNLTDAQIKLMDKTDSSFNSNAIVKEFESAINQIEQLQTALNDASGVGDMSAIFTFMKTLDPSSVVRESEFNSAAATAGVLNPSAIFQKIEKNANGKFLTQEQREDFKKIAIEFIKTKANNYNVKYNDLLKRYGEYGIDPNLAPTNMAELVISQLEGGNTTTQQSNNWYDKYTTVGGVGGVGTGSVVTVGGIAYSSNFYDN